MADAEDRPSPRLFLLGFNGRDDNLGDQFIYRTLVDSLAPLGSLCLRPRAAPFLDPPRPAVGDRQAATKSLRCRLRGGEIVEFLPPGGRTWTPHQSPAPGVKSLLKRGVFRALGGRRVLLGASVIPTAGHEWLRQLDWVGMRDQQSLDAVGRAGIKHVHYFPDLAFLASVPHRNVERPDIGFTFRKCVPEIGDAAAYSAQLEAAVAELLDVSTATDLRPVFFHQVEEDANYSRALAAPTATVVHEPKLSLESFAGFFESVQFVISNRLHALLLGASCGAIPIALTSREHVKLVSLFETVGWSQLVLPVEQPDLLRQRFDDLLRQASDLERLVAERFAEQRELGHRLLREHFGGS